MGALDTVLQYQAQGKSDQEIVTMMRQQGFNPRQIDDALNQARIKSAVSNVQGNQQYPPQQNQMQQPQNIIDPEDPSYDYPASSAVSAYPSGQYPSPDMRVNQGHYNPATRETNQPFPQFAPSPIAQPQQQPQPMPRQPVPQAPQKPAQDYYTPQAEGYDPYQNYPQPEPMVAQAPTPNYAVSQSSYDASSMIEVARQIVRDELSEMNDQMSEVAEFKSLAAKQIEELNKRLYKIENTIDRLQSTILEKIGAYGNDVVNIRKEMEMMQDSFTKVLNPITDHLATHQTKKTTKKAAKKATKKKTTKKSSKENEEEIPSLPPFPLPSDKYE